MSKLLLFILLIAVLALIQLSDFSLWGIKPDLPLVGIIAISFFVSNIWENFLLAAVAVFMLKFSPALGGELIIFLAVAFAAIIAKNYFPWRRFINSLIIMALAVFVFYLFAASHLLYSGLFLGELALNLIFGSVIFSFLLFCEKINTGYIEI